MLSNDAFEEAALSINYRYRHSAFLGAMVRWLQPESVVEIGTHIGATAVHLARALQLNGHGHLACIDPFCWIEETQEEQWEANIDKCGVRDYVTLIKGRSQEVEFPPRVDFAYIDGNHTYDAVKSDTEKAKSLGASLIAIHDTVSWEGSRRYAEEVRLNVELCGRKNEWNGWDIFEQPFDCGITILMKQLPKGPCEGQDVGEKWDRPTVKAE